MNEASLRDAVCLVSGASRGVGRGIALALGDAGATVYVTARTTRAGHQADTRGTIDDTAEEVTRRGGHGIPVRCDHADPPQVESLFRRIADEQDGRLDVVASNAWGGYEGYDPREFASAFPDQPFDKRWGGMFERGVKGHLLCAWHAARHMVPRGRGLIVVTVSWDRDLYFEKFPNAFYYAATQAVRRAVHAIGAELRSKGVTAVALAPGFTRTEKVLDAFGIDESRWREVEHLAGSESPLYSGRAVVALATDPGVIDRSGGVYKSGELARAYGFTDHDGRVVPPFEVNP